MISTDKRRRRPIARAWLAFAAGGLVLFASCRSLDLRGNGFRDHWGDFVQQYRTPADSSKFWGFDQRSREIEQDLGVN